MKKILSFLLTFMILFQMITPVFANTEYTLGNDVQENKAILERLDSLHGDELTEETVKGELYNMGLLDDEGNLKVSETIMVDNAPMTLAQVKVMLSAENVDLTQKVNVDGTELTLGDLKIMIEIEEELARIKETYFSQAVPFTQEHEQSFDSLVKQIENEGIVFQPNLLEAVKTGEAVINHDARIKVNADTTKFSKDSSNFALNLNFSLVDKNGNLLSNGLGYDVSFDWRVLDGSAQRAAHYELSSNTGFVQEGTVSIAKGNTSAQALLIIKLSKYDLDYANTLYRWQGDKIFSIQVYDPVNILFEGNTRAKDVPVTLTNDYEWRTSIHRSFDGSDGVNYEVSSSQPSFPINFLSDNKRDLLHAVYDVFGGIDNAHFEFYPYIRMDSLTGQGHQMKAKPMLLNKNKEQIPNAQYKDWNTNTYCSYADLSPQTLIINSPKAADPQGRQHYVKFSGCWPGCYMFINPQYDPGYQDNAINIPFYDINLKIIDTARPTVKSITAPAGSYYSGQIIPITVEFSEPVKVKQARLKLQGDNMPLSPAEASGTISKYASFLYTVPASPNKQLIIGSVDNIVDMKNNKTYTWTQGDSPITIAGVSMESDSLLAFQGLSLNNLSDSGSYVSDDLIEVKLTVDKNISQWLEDDYDTDTQSLKSVYLKAGNLTYPLTMREEGAYYIASIPSNKYAQTAARELSIELYKDGTYTPENIDGQGKIIPAYFSGGNSVIGMVITANISPLVLVQSIAINESSYPENNKIYLTSTTSTTLSAIVTPATSTYPNIEWESSDNTIASISADGVITAVKAGEVNFTALAKNGGFGTTVSSQTPVFTVVDGGSPAIVFSQGNNAFYTKKNEPVQVVWKQNLIGRTQGVSAEFTVEIYEGNYASVAAITGTPIHTAAVTDLSNYTIPLDTLAIVSNGKEPAYTVKVSAVNPDNANETLSAIAYIIVYPQPARVSFDKLESYYITDARDKLNIKWTLSEFTSGDFEFKIIKNESDFYKATSNSDSYTLKIDDVASDSLKDIYTVSIRAKNTMDDSWSTDSFVLHVYKQNALDILIDGQSRDDISMGNNNAIKTIYENDGSAGILDLGRDIGLKNMISINYGDYAWGNITDRIKWASSDSDLASVNYRQGTLYENVERFRFSSYRPSTEFMLAGNSDGRAVVTAAHAATGMKDTVNVDVKTLRDKLYIFNFYPKQKTTITYTNGKGEIISLDSNANGEIAVFEEKGIVSDITLKSGEPSNLYLGTLYKTKLISSEGDPGLYELYPVNIFKLRPAARVELFFKNSNGDPYTGNVSYRGAVYKNGDLCEETMESNGRDLLIGSDGRFTLNLDSTEFWVDNSSEELMGSDKLEFIYELIFADDYYPQLVSVNGNISIDDTVRFGESVVNLKAVSVEDKDKPFMLSQSIDYNLQSRRTIDVTTYTGSVGPGNTYPTANLETIVAWWGSDKADGYDLKIKDEYGGVLSGQKVKTILYPFATMAYSKNVTTLSESSLNLGIGEKKGARVAFYRPDGTLWRQIDSAFTFTNMVGAPAADDSSKGVEGALQDLNNSGDLKLDASAINTGDGIIGKALNFMEGVSMGGRAMNLMITATEDPMIYRGLITISQGLGDTSSAKIDIGGADDEVNIAPGIEDILDMKNKTSDDILDECEENASKAVSGGVDHGISFTGYFEVEARFDAQVEKWKMIVLGGGFDLNSFIGYTWIMNTWAGPVPLTGEFGLGAQANVEFRATKPYGSVPQNIKASDVNDFLTAMRLNLYIKAFGGFGFDYSVVALKIGVFGQVDLGYNNEFLNRPYLSPDPLGYDKIYAMNATISGQVGLKFLAKLLFLSYEAVLASRNYSADLFTSGNPELIEEWRKSQNSGILSASRSVDAMSSLGVNQSGNAALVTVSEKVVLESRDYLSLYDRAWGGCDKLRLLEASNTQDIQSNAYPYANPVVTRDGRILAYMSDSNSSNINDTHASWAIWNGSEYSDQGALPMPISVTSFADNNLKLDGSENFAVAAWEKQGMEISAADSLSSTDIASMLNSSDILASVYDGSNWTTTRLTEDLSPDLSPVAAAKDGRAIVVWRSVAGSNMSSNALSYDDVNDTILYKIYANGKWGECHILYNGSSGHVKGVNTAMLSDGTAAVAYTLDCGTAKSNPAYGYETLCAIISKEGSLMTDLRLTNDDTADENPQIAAVDFKESAGEKFVIAWHNVTTAGISDIRLAAISRDGTLYDGFIDSISSVNENSAVAISNIFRFAKGENINLDDLSLLWVEPSMELSTSLNKKADKDSLKAVKFMRDRQGRVYMTTALDVTTMDDYTLIDHFDAYTTGANTIRAVMLASSYTGELQNAGNGVYTVDSISSMKSAFASYENDIRIQDVYINYAEIKNDFTSPIQFTVSNMGVNVIDSIDIILSDGLHKNFADLNLLPNQAVVLTVDYDVPSAQTGIHDIEYTVTANFNGGDKIAKSAGLNLDIPDVGISRVELISDEQGSRVFQATLQNLSDVPMAGSNDRKVYVGFYTSPQYTDASKVKIDEITGDDLLLLDESALTMRFSYTVPVTGIPQGGTRLYGRIWVEEKQQDGSYDELIEYYQSNNARSILLPNPIEANNGKQFLVRVEQENGTDTSTAFVTVKNLSMNQAANGNILAQLLDSAGNVIESKLLANKQQELLNLAGEESVTKSIVFSKLGAKVLAEYFTADPNAADAGISSISLLGINMNFDKQIADYSLSAVNLIQTTVMVTGNNMGDTVEIRSSDGSQLLASGTGAVSYTLNLPYGQTPTTLQIVAPTQTTQSTAKTYNLSIVNTRISSGAVLLNATGPHYKSAAVTVTADNLSNFTPTKWQYMKNGTWSEVFKWMPNQQNKFVLSGIGTYTVNARLFDQNGYYMDSNDTIIEIIKSSSSGSHSYNSSPEQIKPKPAEKGNFAIISIAVKAEADTKTGLNRVRLDRKTLLAALDKVKKAESSGQKAVLEIKAEAMENAKEVQIEIPGVIFRQLADTKGLVLKVDIGMTVLSFDVNAVNYISNTADSGDIKISIKKVDAASLPEEVQAKIGNRPVFDFSLQADGKEISSFGGGKVFLSISYIPKASEKHNAIVIYHIDGEGKLNTIMGRFNPTAEAVEFSRKYFSRYGVGYNEVNFTDVKESAWYNEAVAFLAARGVVNGVGKGSFAPNANVTRADFLIIVMNAYDIELDQTIIDNFADAGNKYYTPYLATAKRMGLVSGAGDNLYFPEAYVSRQDMALILYRILDKMNELPTAATGKKLSSFEDTGEISGYAKQAMRLFVESGILSGDGKNLNPKARSSRAQAAQILYNLQ